MDVNKAELRAQGMSEEDIQDVIKYEEEQKADEDLKKYDENMQKVSENINKRKQEQLAESLEKMKTEQFLNTEVGNIIIEFVAKIIRDTELELSPFSTEAKDLLSVTELGDTYVEFLFFDNRYRSGSFYFDFGALYQGDNGIEIDYKLAYIKNVKYWAKRNRSLVFFNTMGDAHTDIIIKSPFWHKHESTSKLLNRLERYNKYYREKSDFETIMDKMTPEIAKKVFANLKCKDRYSELFN